MAVLITPPQDTVVGRLKEEEIFPNHWSSKWHIITKMSQADNSRRYIFESVCTKYVKLGRITVNEYMYNYYAPDSKDANKDDMLFSTIAEIKSEDLCPICWPFEKFDPDV